MPEDRSAGRGYTYTKNTFTSEMQLHILESKRHDKKRRDKEPDEPEWKRDGRRGMFGRLPCMSGNARDEEEQINALLEEKFGNSSNEHINRFKEKYDQGLANSGTLFLMKHVNNNPGGVFNIFEPASNSFVFGKNNDDKIEVTATATDHNFMPRQSPGSGVLEGSIISVFTLGLQNNLKWEHERIEFSNSIIHDLACHNCLGKNVDEYQSILGFARIEEELWGYIESMADTDLKNQAINVLKAAVEYRRAHPEDLGMAIQLISSVQYSFIKARSFLTKACKGTGKKYRDEAIQYLATMNNCLRKYDWDIKGKNEFKNIYKRKTGRVTGHFHKKLTEIWKSTGTHKMTQANVIRHMRPGNKTCRSEAERQRLGDVFEEGSNALSARHGFFGGYKIRRRSSPSPQDNESSSLRAGPVNKT